ncbi:MAG: aminodeoxychorismate/anthranilate synthase component II [Actinomycetaceae bacterium]|nr:aminodeoxychorismate/anthranilate synthase component II [Arcanobacterium sp.]MDD7504347.1 aminodeoxychorismate/anthranilate synthase component II [Actinomycetaceae bacterium]MDY6143011.1 aminodeoxychorismate/anthranilate synthase component II [Arcanobacterium sp.]
MILLIDNYDSFSYNLYQLLGSLATDVRVVRNDELSVAHIAQLHPNAIVISPGPGRPQDAGVCEDLITACVTEPRNGGDASCVSEIPILGVCLGHQAICEALGGEVTYAKEVMHGKSSLVTACSDSTLFAGIASPFEVARYHSLAARHSSLPDVLRVTASTDDGEVMAVEHRDLPIFGVQFHPESILTPLGPRMVKNFLREAQLLQ